jgi:DNA transformation protein
MKQAKKPAATKIATKGTKKAGRKSARKSAQARQKPATGAFAHLRVSDAFRDYVLTQLDELDDVTSRAMFGGVGLYRRGVFFGIIAGDVLYFKVGEANRRDFERYHAEPFRPYRERPSTTYFAVPVEILESAQDLAIWARKSLRAAAR